MKQLMVLSVIGMLVLATSAEAQQRQYNGNGGYRGQNYNQGYRNHGGHNRYVNRGHNRNVYIQNNYGRRGGYGYRGGGGWNNGGAWAAGLGGLALGAILGGARAAPNAYAAPVYGAPVAPVVPGPVPNQCYQVGTVWNGVEYVQQYVRVC